MLFCRVQATCGLVGAIQARTTNPGLPLGQRVQLAEALDTPLRALERWLKQLRNAGRIEFVGSPKTGYHARAAP